MEEIRRSKEMKTVVIVGDDAAFTKMIQQVADQPITFGWVPVGQKTELAERFGLPYGAACASILSRRRVLSVDIGKLNQYFFLDYCHVPLSTITMSLDGAVSISAMQQRMECHVWNVPPQDKSVMPHGYSPSPFDRQLEIVLQPVAKRGLFGSTMATPSIFPFREARLKLDKAVTVEVDGHTYKESHITISLCPQQFKLIVGRVADTKKT